MVVDRSAPESACHVVFTSGSTGKPKGVVCSHRAMLCYARAKTRAHAIGADSRVLFASALTWDPSLGDIFPTLAVGATLCLAPIAWARVFALA